MLVKHAHGGRLNGNAALTLDIHGVEQLLFHVAFCYGIGELHHAVGQRRFAVVDMRNDGEVANQFVRVCHKNPSQYM
jgi:hypothetical protein